MTEAKEVEKLPEGWKRVRLGEVIKQIKCVAPRGSKPYLEIGDIDINSKAYSITEKVAPNHCLKAKEDNIIISKVRPTRGAIARIRETDIFVSPALLVIEYKEPSFLFFVISRQKFFKHLGTLETGTTYPSVNDNDILSYEFDIPIKISEQRKIAEILESVDNAIEKTDRIIEKYKSIKQGLMQDLLTKGIDENGQIRSEETHRFKDSPLGRIPEEWEVVRLGDVAELKGRIGWRGYTFEDLTDEGPITLGATNISDENKIDLSNTTHITYKKFNESPEIKVCVFDIILVQRGSIGKVTIIDRNIGDATINPSIILIKKIKISPQFLYNVLTSHKVQSQIESILSQTGVPMISQSQARRLMLLIPKSKPEQHRIASILSQIDETIEKEQRYKEKLERIKQGLMDDLLTGKVRVNHLIKEGVENVSQA